MTTFISSEAHKKIMDEQMDKKSFIADVQLPWKEQEKNIS